MKEKTKLILFVSGMVIFFLISFYQISNKKHKYFEEYIKTEYAGRIKDIKYEGHSEKIYLESGENFYFAIDVRIKRMKKYYGMNIRDYIRNTDSIFKPANSTLLKVYRSDTLALVLVGQR